MFNNLENMVQQAASGNVDSQAVEQAASQHVQQCGDQRDGRQAGQPRRAQQHSSTHREHDQAEVLDRRIGEQRLQVGGQRRLQDAVQGRKRTDDDQQHAEPAWLRAEQHEIEAQQLVPHRDEYTAGGNHGLRDAAKFVRSLAEGLGDE